MWTLVLGGIMTAAMAQEDPFLWLEDVEGERALAWVKEQNAASLAELTAKPGYAELRDRLQALLDSDEKIPYVTERGGFLYNFWQDAEHPQGVWRRTTLQSYRTDAPAWEVLLDLDALSAAEGKRWVWHGADCLPPAFTRCLVSLSDGGSDADVTREFDLDSRSFVPDGFVRPEAKGSVHWVDRDHVLLTTDLGPGTVTSSGYPRQVRLWKRGEPMEKAPVIFEGSVDDVGVSAWKDHTPGFEREIVHRSLTFWTSETFLKVGRKLVKLDVPEDAEAWMHREHLLVQLRSDWTTGGLHGRTTFPAGSLLTMPLNDFLKGKRRFVALFTPTERSALAGVAATRHTIVVNELVDVRNRLTVWRPVGGTWTATPLDELPAYGTIGVSAVDPWTSDEVWITLTDFLTPTTLSRMDVTKPGSLEALKALPPMFDTAGLTITQRTATSADGTKVPYFLVMREDAGRDGPVPTLLYGYGGFEVSLTPSYSAATGVGWLERGGAYALANIRGGGEYGPRWHQAALKQNRHKAYEDFAAVARDLVATGVTVPARLGAMGGSNGGLLMGNMLTQYPDLFGAIVCQVPLLDMKRFHKLLAGASWMGEYGDPDSDDWSFIQTFSPYHLARPDVRYPRVLFTTSTRDDRVHPGHARKMVAKLEELGHDVLYWENTEGGHGGAANNAQRAQMWALSYTFLWEELTKPLPETKADGDR